MRRIAVGIVGREQRDLATVRRLLEDPLDIVDEAHAQHLVGLVQHQGLQVLQHQASAAHVIHDAAGRADHDLHAAPQRACLATVFLATVDRQHLEAGQMAGVALHRFGDLDRQLAGRRQDHQLQVAAAGIQARQQRQRKGRRLAGAGLRLADQAATVAQQRNRLGLDWGRRFVADLVQCAQQFGAQIEVGKAGCRGHGQNRVSARSRAGPRAGGGPLCARLNRNDHRWWNWSMRPASIPAPGSMPGIASNPLRGCRAVPTCAIAARNADTGRRDQPAEPPSGECRWMRCRESTPNAID